MQIVVTSNGYVEPFAILYSNEFQLPILISEIISEEKENGGGDIDFGSVFPDGEFSIKGIVEYGSSFERNSKKDTISALIYECLSVQEMVFESYPEVKFLVRTAGKASFEYYPTFMSVDIPMRVAPFRRGVEEHALTGNGTISNAGTFETGLVIEILGPVTNPSLTIGGISLSYTGSISAGQSLIINTENGIETAKIGSTNAMAGWCKLFPVLPAKGSYNVTAGGNVTIRWKDRWL